jgi:hypothetical protein
LKEFPAGVNAWAIYINHKDMGEFFFRTDGIKVEAEMEGVIFPFLARGYAILEICSESEASHSG